MLRDVSFEVASGERVGVVGATGAGKTTLINLLMRFYDVDRGRITVDGADIRDIPLPELRQRFGLVLQDVYLFSGSVRENIRLGHDAIGDAEVRAAARSVHADRFIARLPAGLDSEVGERGATLSVGQRQLLSFARALAFAPEVLLLDEATSSVDTDTERLIQDALHILMAGRTTIAIAHRLSTVQDMDQILVFHKGELREAGTHQQLLARRGLYHTLYQLQYRDQERAVGAPERAVSRADGSLEPAVADSRSGALMRRCPRLTSERREVLVPAGQRLVPAVATQAHIALLRHDADRGERQVADPAAAHAAAGRGTRAGSRRPARSRRRRPARRPPGRIRRPRTRLAPPGGSAAPRHRVAPRRRSRPRFRWTASPSPSLRSMQARAARFRPSATPRTTRASGRRWRRRHSSGTASASFRAFSRNEARPAAAAPIVPLT